MNNQIQATKTAEAEADVKLFIITVNDPNGIPSLFTIAAPDLKEAGDTALYFYQLEQPDEGEIDDDMSFEVPLANARNGIYRITIAIDDRCCRSCGQKTETAEYLEGENGHEPAQMCTNEECEQFGVFI